MVAGVGGAALLAGLVALYIARKRRKTDVPDDKFGSPPPTQESPDTSSVVGGHGQSPDAKLHSHLVGTSTQELRSPTGDTSAVVVVSARLPNDLPWPSESKVDGAGLSNVSTGSRPLPGVLSGGQSNDLPSSPLLAAPTGGPGSSLDSYAVYQVSAMGTLAFNALCIALAHMAETQSQGLSARAP